MIEENTFLVMYLLTEFVNYLLAYVVIFHIGVTRKIKNWIAVTGIALVFHFVLLRWQGIEAATGVELISMVIIPIFLLQDKTKKKYILYPFVVIAVSVICVSLSFLLAILLGMSDQYVIHNYKLVLFCQVIPSLILLIIYFYQRRKQLLHIHLGLKQYILLYVGAICTFTMLSSIQTLSGGDISQELIDTCGFFISICCIVFIILILWQGIIVHREIQAKEQNRMYEGYITLQEEHFRQLMEQDEKMRRFRHDMNAHMAVLRAYSIDGKNEQLIEYLDHILENSAMDTIRSMTGNRGVDAVLQPLLQEAEDNAVKVKIMGKTPDISEIEVYDLCTIFFNLFKNALEACEKIEKKEERIIMLEIGSYNEHIFITMKNRVKTDINVESNQLITSKENNIIHGIGSKNVEDTVRKYDGRLQYQCANRWFWVEIIL